MEQALKKIFLFQTEDEDKDEQIKRECEKIFHPEKFEFHDLTTSLPTIETPNIDWWVMAFLTLGYIVNVHSRARTATEMDGTLHTDFRKSEISRDIKKYF